MVRYDYTCDGCEITTEFVVENHTIKKNCGGCGKEMRREFPMPNVTGTSSFRSFYHYGEGRWFHSSKEVDDHLRANGLVDVGRSAPKAKPIEKKKISIDDIKKELG